MNQPEFEEATSFVFSTQPAKKGPKMVCCKNCRNGIKRVKKMNTEIINLRPDDKQFNGANDEPEVEKIETYVEEGEYFEKDEVKEDLKDTENNSNFKWNENDVDNKFIENTFVKKE